MQATCTSLGPKKHSQAKDRESWYGKLDSLLAQTLQKLKRKDRQEKLVFKTTQKLNKIPGTLESLSSMVTNSVVGKISLRTSKIEFRLCMQI
jgi:hypothetical protein